MRDGDTHKQLDRHAAGFRCAETSSGSIDSDICSLKCLQPSSKPATKQTCGSVTEIKMKSLAAFELATLDYESIPHKYRHVILHLKVFLLI